MVALDDTLVRNLTIAFKVADLFAAARGLDRWDVRDLTALALVTESYDGYIFANDGEGYREPSQGKTNWNQTGTPASRATMRAKLRVSLTYPYDKIGSNGRSTGAYQQISSDVGGGWGPMRETMLMNQSTTLFLGDLNWADRSSVYKGKQMANWQTAMLLRTQQPLAIEVEENYGGSQLVRAQEIARDPRFSFTYTEPTGQNTFLANLLHWSE